MSSLPIIPPSMSSLPMESRDVALGADLQSVEILPPQITAYEIIDGQTGRIVGRAKSRNRAHSTADRKDLEYGAVRYRVKPVYWTARD